MIKIPRLSKGQFERLSEILGNICVAWFSAGVISPIFVHPQSIFDFILTFVVSLIMAGAFLAFSLYIMRKVR